MIDRKIDASPNLGPEPWMRLRPGQAKDGKTESAKAYAIFQRYLYSPPDERSLRALASKVGKHRTQLSFWSSRFYWVERIEAWDRRQSQIAAAECERRTREEAEKWEARRREAREEKYAMGKQLRQRGELMVNQPIAEKKINKTDAGGKQTVTWKPSHRMQYTGVAMIRIGFQLTDESIREADPACDAGTTIDVYETVPYDPSGEDHQ